MNSSTVFRLHCVSDAVGPTFHQKSVMERPGMITMNNAASYNLNRLPMYGGKIVSSTNRHGALVVSCMKTSEATIASTKGGL